MDNKQIRVVMRDNNIYMWQVAKKLNVNETSFCKWFREDNIIKHLYHKDTTLIRFFC